MSDGPIFIKPEALKQMIAWSLLCLGILKSKDHPFTLTLRPDGAVVEPEKR